MKLYLLLGSCFAIAVAISANIMLYRKATYFKDIDFSTFEGIDSISKNESKAYLEIISRNEKSVTLKIFVKDNQSKNYDSHVEKFTKIKDDWFYQFNEETEDDPNITVKHYKYIKQNKILLFDIATDNGQNAYTRISIINISMNEIVEIMIYNQSLTPDPNTGVDEFRNMKNVFTITNKKLRIENDILVVDREIENIQENKIEKRTYYYEGFPDKKINKFWNLYKYYLGKDIR